MSTAEQATQATQTQETQNQGTPETGRASAGGGGASQVRGVGGLAQQQAQLSPGGAGGFAAQSAALQPGAIPRAPAPAPVPAPAVNPAVASALSDVSPQERQRLLRQNDDAIDDIEDLLSYGAFDWNVTEGEARRAIAMLEGMGTHARMAAIQELNTRNGAVTSPLLERMLENLDASQLRSYPKTVLTMHAVNQDPEKITAMFSGTPRSHGITPGLPEMALAMRIVPESSLTELARTSNAANAEAWLSATPAPVGPPLQQRFSVVRSEEQAREQEAAQMAEQREEETAALRESAEAGMADPTFAQLVQDVEEFMSYGAFDWAITDSEARQAYGMLCGVEDPQRLRAIVFQLDQGGFMDRLLDNLPAETRWADRNQFLHIISARQPHKNVEFAQELLSYGVFDWAITDEDARLAFQIARQLPPDIRREFQERDGGQWWERMEGNLSTEDASDRDANFYNNAEQSQELKLNFQENCATMPPGQVKMQAEMLARMGEVDFLESAMNAAGLDSSTDPVIQVIYTGMGLATNSQPRDQAMFEHWRDNQVALPDDGNLGSTIMEALGILGFAIDAAIGSDEASVNIDLNRLMGAMDGSMAGVTLADRAEGDNETNTLDLTLHESAGTLKLVMPTLAIASVNRMADAVQLQTGPITVTEVDIDIKWPTPGDPSQHFRVSAGSAVIEELWQVTDSDMTGVGKIELGAFSIVGERAQGEMPEGMGDGLALVINELMDTFTQLGAAVQLESPEPGPIAEALGSSLLGGMGAQVTLESLNVSDYASSTGDYVGQASINDVAVDMSSQLRTDQLRTRISDLEAQETRTPEQETALTAARTELEGMTAQEARFNELLTKQNTPEVELEPYERAEMQILRDQLTVMSGSVDVGSVNVTDVRSGGNAIDSVSATGLSASMTAQRPGEGETAGTEGYQMESSFAAESLDIQGVRSAGTSMLDAYEARHAEVRARIQAGNALEGDVALCESLRVDIANVRRDIQRRDELQLTESRTPEMEQELADLNAAVGPWTALTGATSVDSVQLRDVAGTYNAQDNVLGMTAGSANIQGIEQDGMSVESVVATDASLTVDMDGTLADTAGVMAGGGDIMSQLASVDMSAGTLNVGGVEMQTDTSSTALEAEMAALEQQQRLYPAGTGAGSLTDAQRERLAELPSLISRSRTIEARVADLQARADSLTPEEQAELQTLEMESSTYQSIGTIQATNVTAGLDAASGTMSFGVDGDSENAGFTMSDFSMGRVVEGERVADQSIDSVSAETMNGELTTTGGALPDMLAISQGRDDMQLSMSGTGVDMQGYQLGPEGEAGSIAMESASADSLEFGYTTANGGEMSMVTEGASMSGYTQISAGRIETLRAEVARLTQAQSDTGSLNAVQQEMLTAAQTQITEYEALTAELAGAREGTRKHRRLTRELATWTEQSTMTLASMTSGRVTTDVSNLGNVMDPNWSPMDQELGVGLDADTVTIGGYSDGTNSVESATLNGVAVDGTNVLSTNNRQIQAGIDSAEMTGYRGDGTWARSASAQGIRANVSGNDMSAGIESARVRGAGSGGNSVGAARLSGAQVNIQNMGGDDQTMSGSVRGVAMSNVRSRSDGMDASIGSLRGRQASFAMGPNGMSGNLRSLSGSDVNVTTTDETGATSTYGVDNFSGAGANFSQRGGTTSGGLQSMQANGITASGAATGNREIEVGSVSVNGVRGQMGDDGSFSAGVDAVNVNNMRSMDSEGRLSTVGSLETTGINAAGNMNDSTISSAGVGTMTVRDARIREDGMTVDLDLATVGGISATDVNYADTSNMTGQVGMDSAQVFGLDASMRDSETGGMTRYQADTAGIAGVNATMTGGGNVTGNIEGIQGTGLSMDQDVFDSETGVQTGTRSASASTVGVSDIRFGANTNTMSGDATIAGVNATDIAYTERDLDGNVMTDASVGSVTGRDLSGGMGADGSMTAGFRTLEADDVSYTAGTRGTDDFMAINTDNIRVGDEDAVSSILMGPDGRISGSIQSIQVGPNTLPDGTLGAVAEYGATSDTLELGQNGASVGEIRLTDFNPADMTAPGSSVQVFDIEAEQFILTQNASDGMTVTGEGARLDSIFVAGQGNGQMMVGAGESSIDHINVAQDQNGDGTRTFIADGRGIRTSGGYAVLNGEDYSVVQARLRDLHGDQLVFSYVMPPPTAAENEAQWEADRAAAAAGGYDPAQDGYVLGGAIGDMDADVSANYRYNQDDDTVMDSIGAFFVGRDAGVDAQVRDGHVQGESIDLHTSWSLLGTPTVGLLGNSLQYGYNAGSAFGGTRGRGDLDVAGLGEWGMNGPTDYSERPDSFESGNDQLDRVTVNADVRNLGGGYVQAGRQFRGNMDSGGSAQINGNVGQNLDVAAQNIGFTDAQAMDGDVTIGSAGVRDVQVNIRDMSSGGGTYTGVIRDARIQDLNYIPAGGSSSMDGDPEATFDAMTSRDPQ